MERVRDNRMAKRPCARPGCVNLVDRGYCDGCRKTSPKVLSEQRRPSAHKRGYTREWSAASKAFLEENPQCEGLRIDPDGEIVINTHPGRIVPATLTDHIIPHKGDMMLFRKKSNWQPGCDECHNVKTAREDGGFGRLLPRNSHRSR
jgi:5-methylcytosine-specific restriction enzyme A